MNSSRNPGRKRSFMTVTEKHILEIYKKIQKKRPVIHCITNMVTVNDCANILLACGASPTMAHHPAEVVEITRGSDALVCNLGATESFDAIRAAGAAASSLSHPVILDPVGVSGSTFRRKFCEELIRDIHPTCIRGNYSEIRSLMEGVNTAVGVDAKDGRPDERALKEFALKTGAFIIASGAQDLLTDGQRVYRCDYGTPMLARITGSGCMSSAMLGAFLSVENTIKSALACCILIGMAGEDAQKKTEQNHGGTMTFRNYFIDEISLAVPTLCHQFLP